MKLYKKTRAGFKVLGFKSHYDPEFTKQIGYHGKVLVRPKKGTGFTKYGIVWFNALFDMNMKCIKIGSLYSGILQSSYNLQQVDIVGDWDFEAVEDLPYKEKIAVEDFQEEEFEDSSFHIELYEASYWRVKYLLEHFIMSPSQHRWSEFLEDAKEFALNILDKDRFIRHWLYAGKGSINITLNTGNFIEHYRNWLGEDISIRTIKRRLRNLEKEGILEGNFIGTGVGGVKDLNLSKTKEYRMKTLMPNFTTKSSKNLMDLWTK